MVEIKAYLLRYPSGAEVYLTSEKCPRIFEGMRLSNSRGSWIVSKIVYRLWYTEIKGTYIDNTVDVYLIKEGL